jgi:hypothetical protein
VFINVGSALTLKSSAPLIQDFWEEKNFLDPQRMKALTKLHALEKIPHMVRFVRTFSAFPASPLFPAPATAQDMLASEHVYFVSGAKDQPYPPQECFDIEIVHGKSARAQPPSRLYIVESDHFSYFSPAAWPAVSEVLLRISSAYTRKEPRL